MALKDKTNVDEEFEARGIPRKNASYFPVDDILVGASIRLHEKRRDALTKYFKQTGTNLTNGIRQLLYEWMDERGIH